MKSKKLVIIVSIAVIAVAAIILNEKLSNKKPSEQSLKFFNEKIGSFIVKDSTGAVTIHKKGDVWVVSPGKVSGTSSNDFATDSASVAIALEKISEMKKSVLISENSEKQSLFEVDTGKGLLLEVFDLNGKSQGAVIIGKNGPDWNSNFVRPVNSNNVYTVEGNIRYSFYTNLKQWRDKLMMSFDKASVKTVSLLKKDGTAISLAKSDTGNIWSIISPVQSPAKGDQVDGLITTLARFNAADFQDTVLSDSALGFLKPELTITVGLPNNSKKLSIGSKRPDGKCYAMVDGQKTIFLINDYDFTALNKDVNSLKEEPKNPAPAAAIPVPEKKTKETTK